MRKYKREEVLKKYKEVYDKLGRHPKRKEYKKFGLPTNPAIVRLFGSAGSLAKELGLPLNGYMKISEPKKLDYVRKPFQKTKTYKDYLLEAYTREPQLYDNVRSVIRRFNNIKRYI